MILTSTLSGGMSVFFWVYKAKYQPHQKSNHEFKRGRRDRDCIVVGLITTYAYSAYHH
jgi:hypothetical protein